MVAQTLLLRTFLIVALCVMVGVCFVCLIRAVKGPRITDRVVALDMIVGRIQRHLDEATA